MIREVERAIKLDRGPFRRIAMRGHALTYRLSRGKAGSHISGEAGERPVLLLTTTGRRTGRPRTVPLVYLRDDNSYLVVGANAGRDQDPAWVHNLEATPSAEIQVGDRRLAVRAARLPEAEAAGCWPALDEMNKSYAEFRQLTSRALTVIRLSVDRTP